MYAVYTDGNGLRLQVDNISKELQTVKDVNLTKLEENIEEVSRDPRITGHCH